MTLKLITFLVFICIYGALAVNQATVSFVPTAVLSGSSSDQISGNATIVQYPTGTTNVTICVTGITTNPNGMHGIHVHQYGDLRGVITYDTPGSSRVGGNSAGDHYNPTNASHGCPNNATHNVGDLGNWQANGGIICETKTFNYILIDGTSTSVIGRAIVIHAGMDDCVNVESSGARIAFGVIGIQNMANNTAHASSGNTRGVCVLQGTTSCMGTACSVAHAGVITFDQVANGIAVNARVNNVTTPHGIHIHDFGDMTASDGTSAGGHWNPDNLSHALPDAVQRHAGDLGNVQSYDAATNAGYYSYTALYTPSNSLTIDNILGRAIVVHMNLDHGNDTSCPGALTNGDSGAREYICVIGIYNDNSTVLTTDVAYLTKPNATMTNVAINNVWTNVGCTNGSSSGAGGIVSGGSGVNNGTSNNSTSGGTGGIIAGGGNPSTDNNSSPVPAPDNTGTGSNTVYPAPVLILGQGDSSRVVCGLIVLLVSTFVLL